METQSIKSKPRKYTEELIFEIISYVHDEIESKTFSYEKMYTKYPTTSGIFLTILKRQGVILSNRSTNFWIGAKPSLDLANLVKEIYIKEYRLNAVKHKERREKLAEYKKHLQSIEEAEKVLKSEELELESSTLYKKLVNEKDYNAIIDESGSKSIDSTIDALYTKASDALVKAEEMYQQALLEIENLKVTNHQITTRNEELKKECCFWKSEFELLARAEPVSKEISEGSLPYPKKYIKILGIKFYVNQ